MTLASLAGGTSVFVDANVLVYHVGAHLVFGPACTAFIERIEQGDLQGFTATHVMARSLTRQCFWMQAEPSPGL